MRKQSFQYFDFLWDSGRRCFDDMSNVEKQIITGHLIAEFDPKCQFEFITERGRSEEIMTLLAKCMISGEDRDTLDFLECVGETSIFFAKYFIDAMFETEKQERGNSHERKHGSFNDSISPDIG